MAELGELRSRLDQAVEKLFNAQEARRLRNQRLMMVLTDFEAKNDALTRENTYLVGLIDRLILIIDKTANSEDERALERTSTMTWDPIPDFLSEDRYTPKANGNMAVAQSPIH